VLLLHEPFSELDADLRARMRELVRRVQRELAVTVLFVTHDQQEAIELADDVVLMARRAGRGRRATVAVLHRPAEPRGGPFLRSGERGARRR
jgi:ABC-type sulfate/molybdate transport systems ATPase subunit